jgi:hypothetical protein
MTFFFGDRVIPSAILGPKSLILVAGSLLLVHWLSFRSLGGPDEITEKWNVNFKGAVR